MYKSACFFAIALSTLGCSDDRSIAVDCARTEVQSDGVEVNCGDSVTDNGVIGTVQRDAGAPVVLKAGCYQDFDVCPPTFEMSWLIEHCTIPYVCPAANTPNPDERICLRFIDVDCWDKNSN